MIYILDAFNIMHKYPEFIHAVDLQTGRDRFIRRVAARPGRKNDSFIIVFDGQKSAETHRHGIKIIYSNAAEKADGKIKELSEFYEGQVVTVVTEDREIIYYVRQGGHKVMHPREFLGGGSSGNNAKSEKERIRELENLPEDYWADLFND